MRECNKFKELDKMIKSTRNSRIKWILAELKMMKICIRVIHEVDMPVNNEEKEALKEYIKVYDDSVNRIETDFLSRIREYL